ncbi:transporter substrate-binding domain-containing protein [Desulfobacterales bacterium HSG2]|nr:transporter substrate-binding domain-containing protein [Desulfobacterales bacterium HSG2]
MKRGMKVIATILCVILTAISLQAAEKLNFSSIEGSVNTLISEKVVTEAYRRIGIEVVVRQYPGLRSLKYSNEGETDGELFRIAGINNKFPNLLMVSVPVNRLEGMVFTKQTKFPVSGWDSLKPYKIGIQRGIKFSHKGTEGMNRSIRDSNEVLFRILNAGRIDIVVMARVNGLKMLRKLKIPGIRALDPPIESYPLYHYLHKKNRHLKPEITATLQEMEKEGLIQKTREQFIAERFGSNE